MEHLLTTAKIRIEDLARSVEIAAALIIGIAAVQAAVRSRDAKGKRDLLPSTTYRFPFLYGMEEVIGSIPIRSTNSLNNLDEVVAEG